MVSAASSAGWPPLLWAKPRRRSWMSSSCWVFMCWMLVGVVGFVNWLGVVFFVLRRAVRLDLYVL